MRIPSSLCLLLIFCSVLQFHKRFLEYFLGFFLMEALTCLDAFLKHLGCNCSFGCGFLVFGIFNPVLELVGLFLLFGFGWKVLNFSWYFKGFPRFLCDFGGKSSLLDNGYFAKDDFDKSCGSKISSCKFGLLRYVQNLSPPATNKLEKPDLVDCDADAENKTKNFLSEDCENDNYDEDEEQEHYDEELEFDILALRKLVKTERRRANVACLELEKERMAAATATEETMAMILRLQNEKSLIEMESNQYRRLAEEKQLHDQAVIHSLQWLVLKHESERAVLEEQLRLCQQKLKPFLQRDEGEQSEKVEETITPLKANLEDVAFDPCLFSSLDLDLSLE